MYPSLDNVKVCLFQTASLRLEGLSESEHNHITSAFVTPLLVDTLVTMLNYYLKELVGNTQTKYKVSRPFTNDIIRTCSRWGGVPILTRVQ